MPTSGSYDFSLTNAQVNRRIPALVYVAVNLINDKMYVGATEKSLATRRAKHLGNARRGQASKFYAAIRKYGAENFAFLTVKECSDFFEALERERELIARLRPEYNMTDGGGGVKGLVFSEESRRRMSLAKLGKPCTWLNGPNADETRKKLAIAARARKGTYHLTEEEKERRRGYAQLANKAMRRPVRCETTGEVFESLTSVSKLYGIPKTSLARFIDAGTPCGSRRLVFSYAQRNEK